MTTPREREAPEGMAGGVWAVEVVERKEMVGRWTTVEKDHLADLEWLADFQHPLES